MALYHEMVALLDFTTATTEGRRALQQMKADNALLFPELVRELEGVAEGAGVPLDSIWVATLINELEILKPSGSRDGSRDGHCSDLFAVAAGGYAEGYAHGHNEDWPGPIIDYFYYVAYTAAPGADFESCAGFVYPGGLVGWAASWNSHGIFLTQNSLFPKHSRQRGSARRSCSAQPSAAAVRIPWMAWPRRSRRWSVGVRCISQPGGSAGAAHGQRGDLRGVTGVTM